MAISGDACVATTNKCTFIDVNSDGDVLVDLVGGTRYYYRIRATVSLGNDPSVVTYNSYWDYVNQYTPAAPKEVAA